MSYGQYSISEWNGRGDGKSAERKTGRQKQVFADIDEIAHLWAHQGQESARNAQGNFYFSGDTIYSYGDHFPIARIVESPKGAHKGERAFVMTTRTYSTTTARHLNVVRQALHGTVFYVPRPDSRDFVADWKAAIQATTVALVDAPKGTRKATKAKLYDALISTIEKANTFCEFFGERQRWKMPSGFETVAAELAQAREKAERAHLAQVRKREAEHARLYAEIRDVVVPHWIEGGPSHWADDDHRLDIRNVPEAYLRIVKASAMEENWDDAEWQVVETSHGARFPLSHAVKVMRVIRKLRDAGETYKRNGHSIHLGHYTLDELKADGTIVAGCHTVTAAEFDRFAKVLEGMEVSK